jgi:hypothetical protein
MPSSWGQPIIRSVMTTDLAPASLINASTSYITRMSSRMSVCRSENQRRRSVASAQEQFVWVIKGAIGFRIGTEERRLSREISQ